MRRAGLEPKLTIVRGGTDGSRLTELGLPTPNLSTGEHNLHSPLEWTCLEEMATAVARAGGTGEDLGRKTVLMDALSSGLSTCRIGLLS